MWKGLSDAAQFTFPPFVFALVVAGPLSLVTFIVSRKSLPLTFATSVAFGWFAVVIGFFVGVTGDMLASTVVGIVATVSTTYLAYLVQKDSSINADSAVLLPAILTFYVVLPFVVEEIHGAALA